MKKYIKVEWPDSQIWATTEGCFGVAHESGWDKYDAFVPQEIYERDGSIMNTTNGHDEDLVERINRQWNRNSEKFGPILIALFKRDIKEIYNADSFCELPEKEDAALLYLISHWEDYAHNYLMHIADDGDLECILRFLRDFDE